MLQDNDHLTIVRRMRPEVEPPTLKSNHKPKKTKSPSSSSTPSKPSKQAQNSKPSPSSTSSTLQHNPQTIMELVDKGDESRPVDVNEIPTVVSS